MPNLEYQLTKAAQHDTLPSNRQIYLLFIFSRAQPGSRAFRNLRSKARETRESRREDLASYCLAPGGFASGVGPGAAGSAMGEVSRSSGGAKQSPAQSLVPLTVPTSLQAIGAIGFACFRGLPPTLGAVRAKADIERALDVYQQLK